MFRNYLKTSLRSLWKNKGFSAINIIGLATGIATCLLIILYVMDELSYDRFNTKASRTYRINNEVKFGGNHVDLAQAPPMQGPTIVRELPQVEQYTRFRWHNSILIKKGNENLRETKVIFADSTLLDVFSFKLISGNPKTILTEPHTLLITESIAEKYFNRTNVAGETMFLNNKEDYKISGVINDIPEQSHFNYDFFVANAEDADSRDEMAWLSENYNTYIVLKEHADPAKLIPELDKMMYRKVGPVLKSAINVSIDDFIKDGGFIKNSLTPIADIHLHSNKLGELSANGSITYVYIFGAIAVFILLIACVNFMNLSTAKSANRAKEVGVRKVLGSFRKNLVFQFLTESMLVSFISLLLSILTAVLLLPWFNNLAGKQIHLSSLFQPYMMIAAVGLVLIVGLLAGSYPALFLSAFKPIEVLKGKLSGGFRGSWLRNTLVVFQFSISIILIAGTLIIFNQLQYMRNKDLGMAKDKLLIIRNTGVLNTQATAFKNELLKISGISQATMTSYLPVNGNRNSNAFFQSSAMDQKDAVITQKWVVDENYVPTLGLKILNGRNLSPDFPTDSNAIVINETLAKALGTTNVLNKKLYTIDDVAAKKIDELHIVGVIKNFNFNSLREMITPLALKLGRENGSIVVKITTDNTSGILAQVKNKWQTMASGEPFVYSFLDEEFNNQYLAEQRTGKIFTTFALLAIFIACLGLFGLAAYAAEQRTKEIGIRKVLGATVGNITGLLSKDFLKLVLLSSIIAFPLSWWAMHKWLEDFAYRVTISWWVFVVSGLIALFIAIFTVIFQAIKAAMANPVKSLRTE